MRLFSLFVCLLCSSLSVAQTPSVPVSSVVLYLDGAIISRTQQISCAGKKGKAVFASLPSTLDSTSVKATIVGGSGSVEGLRLSEHIQEKAVNPDADVLLAKIDTLQSKIVVLNQKHERLESSYARLVATRVQLLDQIGREMLQPKPNLTTWNTALDVVKTSLLKNVEDSASVDAERQTHVQEVAELQQKISSFGASAESLSYDVVVSSLCATDKEQLKVEVSYFQYDASWSPVYEAHSMRAKDSVSFSMQAMIRQNSGEQWSKIKVSLSTAHAQKNSNPPKPLTLMISTYEQQEQKKRLMRRDVAVAHMGNQIASAPTASSVGASDEGLSTVFALKETVDLAGNGRAQRVNIETIVLPATYSLVTVPLAIPVVLKTAKVANRAAYPLLAGTIDLFAESSFIGKSELKRVAVNESFDLAFGAEESIRVRRFVDAEKSEPAGILGNARRMTARYRYEFESYAPTLQSVLLKDHIPISEFDDVSVSILPTTTGGYQKNGDGLMEWNVSLNKGESKKILLEYTIDIPSSYDVSGL